MKFLQAALVAAIVALGLAAMGFFIGTGIKQIHVTGRHVTVKGLSERVVASNQAALTIFVHDVETDRAATFAPVKLAQQKVVEALKKAGLKDDEIVLGQWSTDEARSDYTDDEIKLNPKLPRKAYTTKASIEVATKNVTAAQSVYRGVNELIGQTNGAVTGAAVTFAYTELGSIRADMIAAATKDARTAALQFAADSGSRVGAIREAAQGVFSIKDKNAGDEPSDGPNAKISTVEKLVRVVTSVDYELTD